LVSTSHPLAGSPSQLAKPGLQLTPQLPAVQVAVPLGPLGHTWPQVPQLFTSLPVATSHPLAGLLSQLVKPALQPPRPHTPAVQVAAKLGSVGHTWPHVPQLFGSLLVLNAHPLFGQTLPVTQMASAVPGYWQQVVPVPHAGQGQVVQTVEVKNGAQAPCAQTWSAAQTLPQLPQLRGLDASCAEVKQPPLQRVREIATQVVLTHAPSTQRNPDAVLHALPQEPQLEASCRRSRHCPLHWANPGRQAHADPKHPWLAAQAVPHSPQSSGLFCRLAQTDDEHSVPLQLLHKPAVQVSPCAQAWAQLPQWLGSVDRLAQVVPHRVLPAGHVQAPDKQESPVGHAVAQLPQWLGSADTLTHPTSAPQLTNPAGHWHTPALQVAPGAQWLPHAPQSLESVCKLTQPRAAPQLICPAGHAQTPAVQVAPEAQTVPQLPQWLGSVDTSVQAPLQTIWLLGHRHWPELQVWPPAHTWLPQAPQPPQLFTSLLVLTSQPLAGLLSQLAKPALHVTGLGHELEFGFATPWLFLPIGDSRDELTRETR
jgi:hypothetical protein